MAGLIEKDEEDVAEELLKKSGSKMSARIDSNSANIIKELEDKIARLSAMNYNSLSSPIVERNRKDKRSKRKNGYDERLERQTGKTKGNGGFEDPII